MPYVSKDTFKETLYETIGSDEELEERLDRAALALLFAAVEAQLEIGGSILAESNFDADSDIAPFRRLADDYDVHLVQIYVTRAREELLESFAERAASDERHPGHGDEPGDVTEIAAKLDAGVWDPLELPGELFEVDLGVPGADAEAVAARLERALG
jgi:hypothetical protein